MSEQALIAREGAAEATRVMEICNACRYCEGLCATFQAMTGFRSFAEADIDYLANLCHHCTACYHDCQYVPPHEFEVNVPVALAQARVESYAEYAWPAGVGRTFARNGLSVMLATSLTLAAVIGAALLFIERSVLFATHTGAGAFYAVIGHGVMVAVGLVTFGFAMISIGVSVRRFWRASGAGGMPAWSAWWGALRDAGRLRYLDGGHGEGCNTADDRPSHHRRVLHQLTMWGFFLCFAATCLATIYDYVFGWVAPYPLTSIPVLLGTVGGLGLLVGPAGLFLLKRRTHPETEAREQRGMDEAFLASLFLVSLTGLVLLAVRETAAMGTALVVHLGFVAGFFVILPYSKFVHGAYRFAALLRFAAERT